MTVHLRTQERLQADPVAGFVWQLLDAPRSVQDLAAQLALRFGWEEEAALVAVRALLRTLHEQDWVLPVPEPTAL